MAIVIIVVIIGDGDGGGGGGGCVLNENTMSAATHHENNDTVRNGQTRYPDKGVHSRGIPAALLGCTRTLTHHGYVPLARGMGSIHGYLEGKCQMSNYIIFFGFFNF